MTTSKTFSVAAEDFAGITLYFVYNHYVGLASQYRSKAGQTRKVNELKKQGYREQGVK